MKHAILLGLIGAFSLGKLQAQTKPTAFLELVGGINTVSGSFGSNTYSNAQSGFAKAGAVFGLQGAVFLSKHWGVGATLSQADYGVNTFALADGYREDFDVDEATAVSKHYTFTNALVGPYYTIGLGKLQLDIRGLIGVSAATLPALRVMLEDQSTFTQNKATATALAYQLGIGLRIPVVKRLGVSVRADYFGTQPTFEVSYNNLNTNAGRQINRLQPSVQSLNATAGICYQFAR